MAPGRRTQNALEMKEEGTYDRLTAYTERQAFSKTLSNFSQHSILIYKP